MERIIIRCLPIEVSSDEIMNLLLGHCMHVLELVKGGEFDDIESIWSENVRFPLEKMLTLETSYVTE